MPEHGALPRDDRGFSLVELLVAILILGIITVPILHTFVTSAKTAARSRSIGQATMTAENIAEAVEATAVKDLSALNGGSTFGGWTVDSLAAYDYTYEKDASGAYKKDGDGKLILQSTTENHGTTSAGRYELQLSGITEGTDTFDAEVVLDTAPYAEQNLLEVTQYTPMDAVFSQPFAVSENPDFLASNAFSDRAVSISGDSQYTNGYFDSKMKRTVTVDVGQNEESGEITATITYAYSYPLSYTATVVNPDGTISSTQKTETLTSAYSYEFYRGMDVPISMYVFFYPNYNTSLPTDDVITIQNKEDLSFSFFLIKQKAIQRNGTQLPEDAIYTNETGYSAEVNLKESEGAGRAHAAVYSNISRNISANNLDDSTRLNVVYHVFYGDVWYLPDSFLEDLVSKEEQNRLYQVSVSLYDHDTNELIYTMTSSKLD